MNLAALLPLLLPFLTQFMKGKSGDELSALLGNNQSAIQAALGGGALGGQMQQGDSASALLATLMPLLMKQQPVVVMPQANGEVLTNAQPQADQINSIETRLKELEKKLKV